MKFTGAAAVLAAAWLSSLAFAAEVQAPIEALTQGGYAAPARYGRQPMKPPASSRRTGR
jgi:hypothetical protein